MTVAGYFESTEFPVVTLARRCPRRTRTIVSEHALRPGSRPMARHRRRCSAGAGRPSIREAQHAHEAEASCSSCSQRLSAARLLARGLAREDPPGVVRRHGRAVGLERASLLRDQRSISDNEGIGADSWALGVHSGGTPSRADLASLGTLSDPPRQHRLAQGGARAHPPGPGNRPLAPLAPPGP